MAKWREPLRIPQSWKDQARAFVIQLERILDTIFNRVDTNDEKIAENTEAIAENAERIEEVNDSKLSLTGGTMTGDITRKCTDVDASKANNNVSTTIWPTTFFVTDKENRIIGRIESVVNPNGNIGLKLYTRNYNTGGAQVAQKGLEMTMGKSGTLTWNVDEPTNFRSAISAIALADLTWANITGKPSTFPPSAHDHDSILNNGGRRSSANIMFGDGRIRQLLATSSMTTAKPSGDGHIIHFSWDNTGGWDAQFFVSNSGAFCEYRGGGGNGSGSSQTWGSWKRLLDSGNYSSYAAKNTEAIKNITRSGTTFTATRCDGTTFTFTQQDNNTWRGFQSKGYSYSYSIGAGAILNVSGSNLGVSTPSGYTPVGFKQLVSGNNDVDIVSYRADQTGAEWVVRLHNRASATKTGSVYVVIFYMQS